MLLKRLELAIVFAVLVSACGSKSTPTAPPPVTNNPPPPPAVTLQSVTLSAVLSSLTQAGNTAQVTATGTFSNGTTQNLTTQCTDWFSDNTFVLTVSNTGLITARNSGQSTITTSCQGVQGRGLVTLNLIPAQLFTRSGTGNTVFDMPTYVRRVRIRGVWNGSGTSNFIVRVGGSLVVNEILRDMPGRTYEGVHLVNGGVTQITNSSTITWTFTEVR